MTARRTFLTLPAEVRDQIYAELLRADRNWTPSTTCGDPSHAWNFDLRIYRTCRQIHHEAEAVFTRVNTFVKLTTPWEEAVERTKAFAHTPVLCHGSVAQSFRPWQLSVTVTYHRGMELRNDMVVDARDVAGFCRMWYYFGLSAPGLNSLFDVRFNVRGTVDNPSREVPLALQQRLFEPWGQVRHLANLTVDGPHNAEVERKLRVAMAVPYPDPTDCLENSEMAKEAGNALFVSGNYAAALQQYVRALEEIHVLVDGKRRTVWAEGYFKMTVTRGRFRGKNGGIVYVTLRVQLVANCMLTYLRLGDPGMAYFWGLRSINIMRRNAGEGADEPRHAIAAATEWGKIYYRTAIAAKALDNMPEAREFIRIAARWLPHDATVQRDLSEWGTLQLG